jgi:hypothetical protein
MIEARIGLCNSRRDADETMATGCRLWFCRERALIIFHLRVGSAFGKV